MVMIQPMLNSEKNRLRFIAARTEQTIIDSKGDHVQNLGSGVMYCYKGHTYLLTAAHCVEEAGKFPVTVECKISFDPASFKILAVRKILPPVYDIEKGLDYAVLEIDNPNNGFLNEDSVRLIDYDTTLRIDLPTATYGFNSWCREGRCFDVRPSDEGLYWQVEMSSTRKEDFKKKAEGISGAGVFNYGNGYFECLGIFKTTRDDQGSGNDIAITKASAFQGLIDSLSSKQSALVIPQYPPMTEYIQRYCVQSEPADSLNFLNSSEPRFTLSDYLKGKAGINKSICHYILVASAQTGKSYELRQVCHILSSEGIYVHSIPVDEVRTITRGSFPQKEALESDTKIIIIIDALDESPRRDYDNNIRIIKEFAKEHPLVPMVVSCRSGFLEGEKLDGFINLYFEVLSWDDICAYVNSKMPNPQQILEYLHQPEVLEFCRTPLELQSVLKIITLRHSIPRTKSAFYEIMIEQHKLQMREGQSGITNELFIKAKNGLERIAVSMLLSDKQQFSKEDIFNILGGDPEWAENCLYYYNLLLENNGMYSFENHAIKESLAAGYLSNLELDKVKKIVCYNGEERIKPQWYNTVMLWLQRLSDSNAIPDDVQEWIIREGRALMLGCDKERINDDLRFKIFELIIQDCQKDNRIYGIFYTNCYHQLYSFAETKDFKIVDYLIEEQKNETKFDNHLYDVLSLSACIDWDALKEFNSDKYSTIVELLFEKIQKYAGREDSISCYYFLYNNRHFYGDEHFMDRIFGILSSKRDTDSINAMCILIYEGDCSDKYIEYLFEVEPFLHQTGTRIVSRGYLYQCLSVVKTPENIARVMSLISNSDFVNKETEYEEYHTMLSTLIDSVRNLINHGKGEVMEIIDMSFNSLYKHQDKYYAEYIPAKFLQIYNDFYKQTDREDILKIINNMLNFGQIDEAEIQKRRERNQWLFEEMCDYDAFKSRILEVAENNPAVISKSQTPIAFPRDGGYDFYVAHFFIYNSNNALEQINNQLSYELFRFYMVGEALLGSNSYVEVKEPQIELCAKTAKEIIGKILNSQKVDYIYVQQTIKLIITEKITVDKEELLGLLPYSYESASIKDDTVDWGQSTKSLFAFIAERFQVDEFLPIIKSILQEKHGHLQDPVVLLMCKYIILNGSKEDALYILELAKGYIGKALADMLLEALLERNDIIEEILVDISNLDNGSILLIASHLLENDNYRTNMISLIESKLPDLEGYELKRALSLLVKSGSIRALDYIHNNIELLKNPIDIYEFNYDDVAALQLLIDLYPHVYKQDHLFNMNATYIIQSIGKIAEQSKENYNRVEIAINELTGQNQEFVFLKQLLPSFYESYLKKQEGEMTVDSVAELLSTI